MKILFILWTFTDIDKRPGGLEITTRRIAQKLKSKGHKVVVIATPEGREKSYEIIDGIKVYRLPFSLLLHFMRKGDFSLHRWPYLREILRLPYLAFKMWLIFMKEKPDVVHMHYVGPATLAFLALTYLARFKFVLTLQGHSTQHLAHKDTIELKKRLFKKLLRCADFITAPSGSLLENAFLREPSVKEKSKVIPNGIDLNEFNPSSNFQSIESESAFLAKNHLPPQGYLYANYRYWPKKSYDKLIFAYRALLDMGHDIGLVVFGQEGDRLKYEKVSRLLRIGKRLRIAENMSGTDFHAVLRNSRFYISFSKNLRTDFTALEAVSLGKPVINSDEESEIISAADKLLGGLTQNPKMNLTKAPYILTVCNLYRYKGVETLIEAFKNVSAEFPEINLFIAGDADQREFLERLSESMGLGDRVIFLGKVDRYEIVKLFKGCEFFVLPSWVEPFGIVNLEAMAAEKAIIATRADGILEVVKDNFNGILVEPKNSDALAEAIMKLLVDKELRNTLARNGKKKIMDPKFSWDNITDEYIEVYEFVAELKKTRHCEEGAKRLTKQSPTRHDEIASPRPSVGARNDGSATNSL